MNFDLQMLDRPIKTSPFGGGRLMKRDMDLVRRILIHTQNKAALRGEQITFSDVDDDTLGRHVELLFDEGLLDGVPRSVMDRAYKIVMVRDLSWSGHDFVAALQNDGVWKKMKDQLSPSELATAPLSLIKALSIGLLEQYLKSKLGL
jgi:hypothetical protein